MNTKDLDLAEVDRHLPLDAVVTWLGTLWAIGWHPMDIARLIGAGKDQRVALRAVVYAIALDRRGWHPEAGALWRNQADDLGATEVWWDERCPYWPQLAPRLDVSAWQIKSAAATLELLSTREDRPQPVFEAPPTEPGWARGTAEVDSSVLARVRGLLAKAESTDYDHEAEAFSAKAQELIARHAIDLALLADEVDIPGGRRIYIDPPYAKAKYLLLGAVARANTCRCVWNDHRATATLVGHRSDLHLTEVLFSSLLLQGTAAVLAAGTQRDGWGGNNTRSWRNAFWHGYAQRIGERLSQAADTARADHHAETGSDSLPVLLARTNAVEAAVDEMFPDLGRLRTSVSNGAGLHAGHRFANRADLGTGSVTRNPRGELSA